MGKGLVEAEKSDIKMLHFPPPYKTVKEAVHILCLWKATISAETGLRKIE